MSRHSSPRGRQFGAPAGRDRVHSVIAPAAARHRPSAERSSHSHLYQPAISFAEDLRRALRWPAPEMCVLAQSGNWQAVRVIRNSARRPGKSFLISKSRAILPVLSSSGAGRGGKRVRHGSEDGARREAAAHVLCGTARRARILASSREGWAYAGIARRGALRAISVRARLNA